MKNESNYKLIEISVNWKNGMTINVPYDHFTSVCAGIFILSLAVLIFSKAYKNLKGKF